MSVPYTKGMLKTILYRTFWVFIAALCIDKADAESFIYPWFITAIKHGIIWLKQLRFYHWFCRWLHPRESGTNRGKCVTELDREISLNGKWRRDSPFEV